MFDDGPDELRRELRGLIRDELPEDWLGPFTDDPRDREISDAFCRTLAERDLLVPEWPVAYGGQGMSLERGLVIREEMWAHGEPRGARYYGPNWVGPSIMRHGTEEQKARHLPAIASGEAIWCQGFSEPDAGSDLAALKTTAVPDGDGFLVSGQKVWTSWAAWADWCYLLARVPVDSAEPRAGITVFLIPMDRAGIEVRPIDGLPGPHHLNEVFFDRVRVEQTEILGGVGGGWRVMRDALSHERVGIARYARSDRLLALAAPWVETAGGSSLRSRWMQARVANRVSRLVCRRALAADPSDRSFEFEANAARLLTTRADQFVAEVVSDAVGEGFFADRYSDAAPLGGLAEFAWRYSQGATIASGTTEMLQLMLVRAIEGGQRLTVPAGTEEVSSAVRDLIGPVDGLPRARKAIDDADSRLRLRDRLAEMILGLDPRESFESALQGAEVCRRAGAAMVPLPVEAMLLAPEGGPPLAWVGPGGSLEHADLFDDWTVIRDAGGAGAARYPRATLGTRLGAFVNRDAPVIEGERTVTPRERSLALALPCFYLLGALETALDLAVRYAQVRVQFSTPIIKRQGVGFRLADVVADLYGLQSLAHFTLWRVTGPSPDEGDVDALALRWHAVDVARRALRSCQQVFGTIGLTYEHDLSWITTGLQPRLRLPFTQPGTLDRLVAAGDGSGFASLFAPQGTER